MTDDGADSTSPSETTPTRRTVLGLAGAGVVGAVGLGELSARTPLQLDAAVPDDEWPVPGRTPRKPNAVPDVDVRGEPTVVWSRRPGERWNTFQSLPPLVAGETVVHAHAQGVSSFDAASGERRWTWSVAGDRGRGGQTLVVEDTVVVVGPDRVRGLELDSGRRRWAFGRGVHGRGCRVGDAVAVVADGDLVLLDAATGRPHWRLGGRAGPTPLCVLDGRLFGVNDSQVVAVDPADGTELFAVDAPLSSTLSLPYSVSATDETVYIGMRPSDGGHNVVAVDTSDGAVSWVTNFVGANRVAGSPSVAVSGGTLHVTKYLEDRVVALNAATGDERWATSLFEVFGLLVVGDHVVARNDEAVVTFDAATGDRVATHELDPPGYGEMAYGDGRLYVRHDETLTALSW